MWDFKNRCWHETFLRALHICCFKITIFWHAILCNLIDHYPLLAFCRKMMSPAYTQKMTAPWSSKELENSNLQGHNYVNFKALISYLLYFCRQTSPPPNQVVMRGNQTAATTTTTITKTKWRRFLKHNII